MKSFPGLRLVEHLVCSWLCRLMDLGSTILLEENVVLGEGSEISSSCSTPSLLSLLSACLKM